MICRLTLGNRLARCLFEADFSSSAFGSICSREFVDSKHASPLALALTFAPRTSTNGPLSSSSNPAFELCDFSSSQLVSPADVASVEAESIPCGLALCCRCRACSPPSANLGRMQKHAQKMRWKMLLKCVIFENALENAFEMRDFRKCSGKCF